MTETATKAQPATAEDALVEHDPLSARFPTTLEGRVLFWIAVAFSVFQLATASSMLSLPSQDVRAIHLGFLLLLSVPLLAAVRGYSPVLRAGAWALGAVGMAVALYQYTQYEALILRAGEPIAMDTFVGVVSLAVLFAACWFVMGWALPVMSGAFLLYCLFGQYLPAPLDTRGYDFAQVVDHMAFGTEGIYGTPIYVSATYIFLFILFGAFLEKAGMIKLFTDVAMGLFGHKRGGPAKVAVISSGFMGMISGSGVANVVTVGQFTIPLMKRFGYTAAFAGGVESTASMGGQIMPPVMGAVAFIMAETLGIPYSEVVKAAIIPALFYFGSAFWMVHLEAGRRGLHGMPASQLPSPLKALREGWYLLLPLAALIYLLFSGYTPLYAGTIGFAMTALLILGGSIALGLPSQVLRTIFWILLGLLAASFFELGIWVVLGAAAVLILANLFVSGGRQTLIDCRDSLAEGAKTALPVGLACAIVGIIIGAMTLTGVANTFGDYIVSIGKNSLLLSLILTMIACIILGTGIPTIPNYIITATIAGPALLALGVPLIVSHMFVFYFGIFADLTPPVALACFAAAPIARESGLRIASEAMKIATAGFVLPFMAVYDPALMLQPGGPLEASIGFYPAVAYIVFKTALAIGLWGAAVVGYLRGHLTWWERLLATAAAFTLVLASALSDQVGFALAVVFFGLHWFRTRGAAAQATASPNGAPE
jgi:TRAP transporter 4TM/12TM fusion protein